MPKLTPEYYLTANGRISRSQWWLHFRLPISVLMIAAIFLLGKGGTGPSVLANLIVIALLVPLVLADIRRFHDRGKSGWWALIAFVPIVGSIWILVELGCLKGTDGPNQFGADPVSPL